MPPKASIKNFFKKFAINAVRASEYKNKEGKLVREPVLYKRADLYNWAKEFTEKGQDYFYTKPVNPANPYGPLELTEPQYRYKCTEEFTEQQYEDFIISVPIKTIRNLDGYITKNTTKNYIKLPNGVKLKNTPEAIEAIKACIEYLENEV